MHQKPITTEINCLASRVVCAARVGASRVRMILGQFGGSRATCGARIARRPRCMCAIQTGMWAVTGYRYLSRGIQKTSCRTWFWVDSDTGIRFRANIATRTASLGPDTPEIMGLNATHRNSAFSTRAGSGHQTGTKPPHLLGQK